MHGEIAKAALLMPNEKPSLACCRMQRTVKESRFVTYKQCDVRTTCVRLLGDCSVSERSSFAVEMLHARCSHVKHATEHHSVWCELAKTYRGR